MKTLDQLVEDQLNLQVKISYDEHHGFLLRHGLKNCPRVLDVGTGNGAFVARLALDHPELQFVGVDKRKYCIESCKKIKAENLEFELVDMFSLKSSFDFSLFDGFLMRYFLLHVDHSRKIMEFLKEKSRKPSRFWMIDLDFSQFHCSPAHPTFNKLRDLVREFCSKKSVDSLGGQRILPMLRALGYQNVLVENLPFSRATIPLEDLALYIKQEMLCYSLMIGRSPHDPETLEIVRFIEEDFCSGAYEISYGMILLSAELN